MPDSRYVILHHRDPAGEHWDLMIEREAALATWKLSADPTPPGALAVQGTRIRDHRKHYLTYEGPLSGNRGEVARRDEGSCKVIDTADDRWTFELVGRRLRGSFRLARATPDATWMLHRL